MGRALHDVALDDLPGRSGVPEEALLLFSAVGFVSRLRGLHAFQGLAWGTGLFIAPCSAVQTFGMRYAIDVVFLDRRLDVVRQVSCLRPNRAAWCPGARAVVELPAGYCAAVPGHRELVARALGRLADAPSARPHGLHRTG
jgi:uncharacterized membrane protein (UPF0127 family)